MRVDLIFRTIKNSNALPLSLYFLPPQGVPPEGGFLLSNDRYNDNDRTAFSVLLWVYFSVTHCFRYNRVEDGFRHD